MRTVDSMFELAHAKLSYRGDGELIRRLACGRLKVGRVVGSIKKDGYRYTTLDCRSIPVHHLVWLMHFRELPTRLDHINGIRSDNRIENLRAATAAQNVQNVCVVWGGTPFKGVTLAKQTGKYQASIRAKYIGQFDAAADAARAYDAAAEKLFGEFARTNASLGLL